MPGTHGDAATLVDVAEARGTYLFCQGDLPYPLRRVTMKTVTKLPIKQAQDALKHLAAAWAYYTAEPVVWVQGVEAEDDRSIDQFEPYYTAA